MDSNINLNVLVGRVGRIFRVRPAGAMAPQLSKAVVDAAAGEERESPLEEA